MKAIQRPVLLTKAHRIGAFDCGKLPLNHFLSHFALVNQANGSARTYVALLDNVVVGYYSLAASAVSYDGAPKRVITGLARHDIPVILMARFAVDKQQQGKGVGRSLFFDALLRSLQASDAIGARAFLVHAKDEEAKAFYKKFNMVEAPSNPLHLYLLFKDVRRTLKICAPILPTI